MEFKGTPGKWFACCLKTTPHFVFDETGETVICKPIHNQEMRLSMPNEEYKANALLISKSPELLDELIWIFENIDFTFEGLGTSISDRERILKLIKSATEL